MSGPQCLQPRGRVPPLPLERRCRRPASLPGRRGYLVAFARGALPLQALERVAAHVGTCLRCADAVFSAGESDPLVGELRRHLRGLLPVTPAPRLAPARGGATNPGREEQAARLGGYELIEVVGRGAMGVVYKAWQPGLNRMVAVKVARPGMLWSSEAISRLRRECEAIARLRHRNIVSVYEFSEEHGVPFFSMELFLGGTLAGQLAAGPLAPSVAARMVRELSEAVQFAHENRILHRDLKPANVLIGPDGSPRLSDFGAAKFLDGDEGLTACDAVIGTASYMSPEQATGDASRTGPRSDVYGLGAILYECLTGRAPFLAPDRSSLLANGQGLLPPPRRPR